MCICEHQVSKEQTLRYIEIKVVRHQRQSINHAEEVCSRSLLTLFVMCLQIDHIANNLSHLLQSESKCKAFHMKISFSIYQTSEYVFFLRALIGYSSSGYPAVSTALQNTMDARAKSPFQPSFDEIKKKIFLIC